MGPFCNMDTLFPGVTRDLELYTTEEVVCLRSMCVVKPSSAPSLSISKLSSLASLAQIQPATTTPGLPKISPGSPKVEPDPSSKRWEDMSSSKGHKCPVSAAAGSSGSLEKSNEWDHDAYRKGYQKDKAYDKNCERSRECKQEHGCPKYKSLHHKHASGHDCSRAVKCGRSAESSDTMEHCCSKEQWLHSQSRPHDREHRHSHTPECIHLLPPPTFHPTPVTSHHASADSNAALWSFDISLDRYHVPKFRSLSIRNSLIIPSGEIHY